MGTFEESDKENVQRTQRSNSTYSVGSKTCLRGVSEGYEESLTDLKEIKILLLPKILFIELEISKKFILCSGRILS